MPGLINTFRCIFFDWDGCLADTLQLWLDAYRCALDRRGLRPSDAVVVRELFNDWAGPARFGVPDSGAFVEEVIAYLERHPEAVHLNPHALEVLSALKARGASKALLSASRASVLRPLLKKHGLEGLLDLVLTVEDVRRHKPDPEVVLKALAFFAAAPGEALFVGDSDKDMQAGRDAGVATALYLPEHNRRFYDAGHIERCRPDYLIGDLRELLGGAPLY